MFRKDVEGMRALAILSVLLFHFDVAFFSGGFLGVDIFFVISGYVISKGIEAKVLAGEFSYLDFYGRRVRRILPAMMVTIALVLVVGFALFSVSAYQDLGKSSVFAALSVSNFYFANTTGYFDASAIEKPLLHMWSLSVEEQFYLVWPFIFVALVKVFAEKKRAIALLSAVLVFTAVSHIWLNMNQTNAFFMAPARFFEFLLGALIVSLEKRKFTDKIHLYDGLFWLALTGILVSIVTYTESMAFPGGAAFLPAASTAMLIYASGQSRFSSVFSVKPAAFLGRISYSLYLVHWPLVVFYKYVNGYQLTTVDILILCVVSLLLAYLMWRYIEQPFRASSDKVPFLPAKVIYKGVLVSTVAVVAVSALIYQNKGLTWRLSDANEKLYSEYNKGLEQTRRCPSREGLPKPFSCYFGAIDLQSENAILIGDSHAINFRPAISELFSEMELKGIYRFIGGCVPIRGASVIHENVPGWFGSCKGKMNTVFKYALKDQIDVVVLAGRWSLYTRNTRLGESGARGNVYLGAKASDERSSKRSMQVFREKMNSTIKKLVENGKKIVVFGQVPNLGFDFKRCTFRPGFLNLEYAGCNQLSRDEAIQVVAGSNKVIADIAEQYPYHVLYIDPVEAFCDQDECISVDSGVPLYSDSNHLIYGGSKRVIEKFSRPIKEFLELKLPPEINTLSGEI